jgi:hypothetical protein
VILRWALDANAEPASKAADSPIDSFAAARGFRSDGILEFDVMVGKDPVLVD